MDAMFYDLDIGSTHNLDGCAKSIPGDPFPLDGSRAGKALRVQQLSFIGNGFPLGIIPSISPSPSNKQLGSFSLQSLLLRPTFGDWFVPPTFFYKILLLKVFIFTKIEFWVLLLSCYGKCDLLFWLVFSFWVVIVLCTHVSFVLILLIVRWVLWVLMEI